MGNSYCKKDYGKGEVNEVQITQIRLQKLKKNVASASFYCLVSKIWKKIEEKKRLVCVVSEAQKTNITFLCRFVIKYS